MFNFQKFNACFALFISLLLLSPLVIAQTKPSTETAKPISLTLEGKTLEGKDFQLAALKGKVSMVMFWSTSCAVCRDKMPELRENVKGWANKPFELVLVSTDQNMKDVDDYYRFLSQIVTTKLRFTQIWTGSDGYKDSIDAKKMTIKQLPLTFILDKSGNVVSTYSGRVPPEVWDDIAALL